MVFYIYRRRENAFRCDNVIDLLTMEIDGTSGQSTTTVSPEPVDLVGKKRPQKKPRLSNRKRSQKSTAGAVTVDENGEALYCICRKPDTGRWMIGCDFCDDWFHGDCVDMDEKTAQLVVKFACPNCRSKGNLGIWRRKCRLSGCFNPVLTDPKSKYCSPEHGVQFFHLLAESTVGMNKNELAALVQGSSNAVEFRDLGMDLPSVSRKEIESRIDSRLLDEMDRKRIQLKNRLEYLDKRKVYIKLAKERAKRISEEMAKELAVKKRDTCGMDDALLSQDDCWLPNASLQMLSGRDGVCLNEKRKCASHNGWQNIMLDETLLYEKQCQDEIDKLDKELCDLFYRQRIKILANRQTNAD
jgi:COMPASS component SPP1